MINFLSLFYVTKRKNGGKQCQLYGSFGWMKSRSNIVVACRTAQLVYVYTKKNIFARHFLLLLLLFTLSWFLKQYMLYYVVLCCIGSWIFYAMTLLYIYSSSTRLICIFPFHIHHLNEMRRVFFARFANCHTNINTHYSTFMWWIFLECWLTFASSTHSVYYGLPFKSYVFIFFYKMCPLKNILGWWYYPLLDRVHKKILFVKIDKAFSYTIPPPYS